MDNRTLTAKEIKKFFENCKGHKFECFYKMVFAYRLSRYEMLNLQWEDINFDNDTITIYPVKYVIDHKRAKNYWQKYKNTEFGRTYPLLPDIRNLLIKRMEKQMENSKNENFNADNTKYVCIDKNGKLINANTLSRNLKYITKKAKLPTILISDLKHSAEDFFFKKTTSIDFYRCWTRADILQRQENVYGDFNLLRGKRFVKELDNLISNERELEM